MQKERRQSDNTDLRRLVNALKTMVDARDALWSLNFIDRMFRSEKCRKVLNNYDQAMLEVRNAILAVSKPSDDEKNSQKTAYDTLITPEELNFLLGKVRL